MTGMEFRLGAVRHVFQFLPPMTMCSLHPITGLPTSPQIPICGKCFKALEDDPFDGRPGQLRPGAAKGSRCFRCQRKCYPCD